MNSFVYRKFSTIVQLRCEHVKNALALMCVIYIKNSFAHTHTCKRMHSLCHSKIARKRSKRQQTLFFPMDATDKIFAQHTFHAQCPCNPLIVFDLFVGK